MVYRRLLRECIAEFLGTMVLILFGSGVVAMTVLFNTDPVVKGEWTTIILGWGIGVTMGIYVAGRISGAHLNPAVTLAMAAYRGFPWLKVLPYSLAQTAGAFAGAALVFGNYHAAFLKTDPLLEKTAGVFATFPAFPNSVWVGFLDQVWVAVIDRDHRAGRPDVLVLGQLHQQADTLADLGHGPFLGEAVVVKRLDRLDRDRPGREFRPNLVGPKPQGHQAEGQKNRRQNLFFHDLPPLSLAPVAVISGSIGRRGRGADSL